MQLSEHQAEIKQGIIFINKNVNHERQKSSHKIEKRNIKFELATPLYAIEYT